MLACALPTACADPCIDDGLGQADQGTCPTQQSNSETDGSTDSNTITATETMGSATMSTMTVGMTGSQSGTETDTMATDTLDGTATLGDTDTETATESETSSGTVWCADADGDGFGDPEMCQTADEQPPGTVDNDDDCDDGNANTFPGAAPNDDRNACMQDEDDDDWGDDEPPPGVDPGTDCLDDDADVFPGAAENEMPPDLCAQDEDDDGWGDTDPPMGADPGTDCLDDDPNTFPGAAPNDDPDACMQDEDDDDWGDDAPPPGVDTGTDCVDDNPSVFPGAAELEMPPGQCMVDEDGDGWGDANPPGGGGGGGGGPVGGADCYDQNPDLNPDMLQLTAMTPYQGGAMVPKTIEIVDPDATLSPFVTLEDPMGGVPPVDIVTGTLNEAGEIFVNDLNTDTLYTVDYAATCMMGTGELAPVGMPYMMGADIVCGLEFGPGGVLYGIDHGDRLLTFNPANGQITAEVPITAGGLDLDINSCGTAYDCAGDRLLVANGVDQSIYSIDVATGEASLLRDLDAFFPGTWLPTGLEWNPLAGTVYLSTGAELYEVDIEDAMAPPVSIGFYGENVSNLQFLPICI